MPPSLPGVYRRVGSEGGHEVYGFFADGLRNLEEYLVAPWCCVLDVVMAPEQQAKVVELVQRYPQKDLLTQQQDASAVQLFTEQEVRLAGEGFWHQLLRGTHSVERPRCKAGKRGNKGKSSSAFSLGPQKLRQSAFRVEVFLWSFEVVKRLQARGVDAAATEDSLPQLLVMLDHLQDPRNMGAIVRSGAFFGVPFIFLPQNRQAGIGDAMVRCSRGGLGYVRLVQVVNLERTLVALQSMGYWVVGADMMGEDVSEVQGVYDKLVLVLGSEGRGVSRLLRQRCDRMVRISGIGQKEGASLNVSVAAGILMRDLGKLC